MTINIRRARKTDASIITDFNASIAKETEHLQLDRKRLIKGVRALLGDISKGFYIVAVQERRVVGQLMITYEWSDWRNGVFWWIQSVYVHADFRGAGVFTSLYRYIEKEARKRKSVCGLRLYVEQANTRARRTYEHLGMSKAEYGMYEVDFVIRRKGK